MKGSDVTNGPEETMTTEAPAQVPEADDSVERANLERLEAKMVGEARHYFESRAARIAVEQEAAQVPDGDWRGSALEAAVTLAEVTARSALIELGHSALQWLEQRGLLKPLDPLPLLREPSRMPLDLTLSISLQQHFQLGEMDSATLADLLGRIGMTAPDRSEPEQDGEPADPALAGLVAAPGEPEAQP